MEPWFIEKNIFGNKNATTSNIYEKKNSAEKYIHGI